MEKNCHILPNCAPKRFSISASFTLAEFSIFLYFVDIFAIHLKLFTWYQNVSRHWNMLLWLLRRSDFFVCSSFSRAFCVLSEILPYSDYAKILHAYMTPPTPMFCRFWYVRYFTFNFFKIKVWFTSIRML